MLRSSHPLSTFTWLVGAVVGVACSIPDYGARQKPEGEGGEDPGTPSGGVSGQSANGGVTSAGNGTMGGSAGNSTGGGTAGDSGGSSGGSGKSGAGDGGESGSNGGNAGSGAAGKGGAGSGGAAGKGGAGNGGTAGKGGAGNGGAGNGGAGNGGAGNGNGGSGGKGGSAGAGNGGSGNGGGGSGGSGPRCITPNSSNLVPNAGFDNSSVSHFVPLDSFIALSHSTLDATDCASSGSMIVTNSHPDGLNSGAIYCITTISPGTTYNVGGWMMEPSGFAQGQLVLQFLFTDGPDCSGSFVGDTTSIQGTAAFDIWQSVRADGLVAPTGAVSFGVHVKAIKNLPNALAYRAHFDMLYATPVPGEF